MTFGLFKIFLESVVQGQRSEHSQIVHNFKSKQLRITGQLCCQLFGRLMLRKTLEYGPLLVYSMALLAPIVLQAKAMKFQRKMGLQYLMQLKNSLKTLFLKATFI